MPDMSRDHMIVGEVKDLGDGKFSVQLTIEAGSPATTVSQTAMVAADGYNDAVQSAKELFSRYLRKAGDYLMRNMPSRMRN
jgi:hypothetical protein